MDKKDIEDYLRQIWVREYEKEEKLLVNDFNSEDIDILSKKEYIDINDDLISLTETGEALGRSLVRKHRIAEKVVADLFLADMNEMEELADQIEHVMSEEVEDNICRILGNPENCPHNKPIPEGNRSKDLDSEHSIPLINCHSGNSGEVSHIKTEDARKLRKIMNLGLIPGSKICLIQKFPNYVFKLGNTQLAVDKELASEIFIKVNE
ncbi:DtxR family transcriptional regulator, Mn-dependent transcriptional regulator [Methanobrevibacter olleyae]|uniref:DtxR family transcriptional regulator, Mn-dependent transcriptional regulator n=1 Tax=Methanobrevibacter olleyae TaxID=294671 RepID=A0A1I4I4K0_METOL|nr:metal-dependent transcriptional regulator [Methanobrevibacter olleyae]SFL49194.1 DtxR family transcriptional regulator, Mn-dependent transcriptional regulator [Methanobrevibacter olleyae]